MTRVELSCALACECRNILQILVIKRSIKTLKTTKGRNWDLKIRTKSKYDKIRHIVEVIVLEKNTTELKNNKILSKHRYCALET